MLEEVKAKTASSTTITSQVDIDNSFHSKARLIEGKASKHMAKNDQTLRSETAMTPVADSTMEVQEDEDGSETMEDAVSDVTSTTHLTNSEIPIGDKDGSDDANGAATKKRVHFADDTDGSIYRSLSSESLSSGKDQSSIASNGPRSNLRKRASSNVNPRPAHLTRKHRETYWGDHLNITPSDSLEFVVMDFQKETLDIINLKNVTEDVVTYKVKTTAPEKYRVRPSTGLIQPGAAVDVNVYLPPGMHSTNRDKFLIMSLVVADSESERGINELNELWKSASKDDIVEHRIRCVLIDQSQSTYTDETIAKDVGELREALEKNNLALGQLQRQCNDLTELCKWNQLLLRFAILILVVVFFMTFLIWQVSRRSSEDEHCQSNKYSSDTASHTG